MNIPSVAPSAAPPASGAVTPSGLGVGTRNTSAPGPLPGEAAATATISPWGRLLNRIQSVATDDPTKLAALAGQLAITVHTAASQATGEEKTSLTRFGNALQQVGKTGNVSALNPLHHHRNHAAKHWNGGTGALLSNLLENIDTVLGPNASATAADGTTASST